MDRFFASVMRLGSIVPVVLLSATLAVAQARGALAIDEGAGRYALSPGSQAEALNMCATTGCEVVTTFSSCLGVAYSGPTQGLNVWAWIEADSERLARVGALEECERAGGPACEVLNVVCLSNPRRSTRTDELALGLAEATRRRIQQGLLAAGLDPGPVDGQFGPRTRSAIRRWQAEQGLPQTGYLDGVAAAALQPVVRDSASVNPRRAEPDIAHQRQVELSAAQIGPYIMMDRHLARAERLIGDQDYRGALTALNDAASLRSEHGLTLPDEFHFVYAQAALAARATSVAIESVTHYLAVAGRSGEFYEEAVRLWERAEAEEERAARAELEAEARRLAEAEARRQAGAETRRLAEVEAEARLDVGELDVAQLRLMAQRGVARAQSELGVRYQMGRGVVVNYRVAEEWYRRAADQGNARGQTGLGIMYRDGLGVSRDELGVLRDEETAVGWFRRAAEQGYAIGQTGLGAMYATGRGVSRNDAEAVRLYRLAAEQGGSQAQNNLGDMYAEGRGVGRDREEAVRWYRRAANQGNAQAQFSLGRAYEDGRGVRRDREEAAQWYRRAADQGHREARRRSGRLR